MFRRLALIILKTLLGLLIVLLLIFFLLQTPFVQDIARSKAEKYLARKLHTRVRIGGLAITFFRSVTLKDVYIEDRHRDTLLAAGLIDVHVRMLGLLHRDLDIRSVTLGHFTAKVLRYHADTGYNYQFIIDAFAGKPSSSPDTTKGQPFSMALHELTLDDIRLIYADTRSGDTATAVIAHSYTSMEGADIDSLRFRVARFELQRTALAYRSTSAAMAISTDWRSLHADDLALDLRRMIFRTRGLRLDSAAFAFDEKRQPRVKKGMDYGHLLVRGLTLHGQDLVYTADSSSGRITRGELAECSGFRLTRLQTRFFYSNRRIALQDLLLQTPGSLLQRSASLRCDSLAGMMKAPAHTLVALDLPGSRVQLSDLLLFAPDLATQPAFRHPGDTWQLDTRLDGSFDALMIHALRFSGLGDIRVDLAGRLLHPMDVRRFQADMSVRNLSGSRASLLLLLPAKALPNSIGLPVRFDLHGHLAGSRDGFDADLNLHTSNGSVSLKGFVHHIGSTMAAAYNVRMATQALDLGSILKDSTQWGPVTADVAVKGTGLDFHSAHAQVVASIHSAAIRHYVYRGLSLDGSLAGGNARLHSTIDDPAVRFELEGAARFASTYPALQLDWRIDTIDCHALGLVKDTLQFKGRLTGAFEDTNPDSLQGILRLTGLDLLRGTQRLATDSIVLAAARQQDREHIQLHSEMADLDLQGRYLLTRLPAALQHTLAAYYRPEGSKDTAYRSEGLRDSADRSEGFKDTAIAGQDFNLRMQLRASPLVLAFVPLLKGTDTLGGDMAYNSDRNDLRLSLRTPRITVGTQYFHNVVISAGTEGGSLHYAVETSDAHGNGFELHRTSVAGEVRDNRLFATLLLRDGKDKDRYRLSMQLAPAGSGVKIGFNPDSLLLNYQPWQVAGDNFIRYDSAGLLVHHFILSHEGDSLSLNSRGTALSSPLDVRFANFRIETLSRLADQDSLFVDGTIDGNAEVRNLTTNLLFTSDLRITKLSYKTDTLGDLTVKVNNAKPNTYTADVSLEGKQSDMHISGDYTGEGRMNLNLDLRQLNLAAFSNVASGVVEQMKGYLRGKLAITGTMAKPVINGSLYFDSSRITPTVTGEPLRISRDEIAFDADGFNFSQFHLLDSAGNKLVIDGNVYTKDYRDYAFDISVNANNFRLVNAPVEGNRQFYGVLNLDAAVNLEGKMASPKVDGDIRVNRKTNFYFVLPSENPEIVDREGVVRFLDKAHPGDTLVTQSTLGLQASRNSKVRGMDVSLNLQTDSNAVFTIVVDERNGDALNVRGRSNLVFGLGKSGKMDLTGSFEVEGGAYNLSLDILKRRFDLQRGSTITWTGDPMTATLDMTATYTAVTPSIDLIANQVAGRPQTDVNKFKQKLPFLVTLKMEGELMKPKITFDISLPPNILSLWPDVDQRLQQVRQEQSELNKQVFALLLLNRFVGEDPLESQAGGGSSLGSMAFQSASQILTNQLDQLAASLIRGVDIHFQLNNEQDYSTGNEINYTELNVTVSKQLNDRIQVSVGSNFDVLGTGAPNQNSSNLAGDVAVDYKLSRDGRYRLRAYRQNQYEAVVEGQVVKTGLSFILSFDYNKLREIFRKTKEEQLQERTIANPRKSSQQ